MCNAENLRILIKNIYKKMKIIIDNVFRIGYTLYILNLEVFMQTNVVKWGNSHGIRLPKAFLQDIRISENDPVDISLENEKIIIKKIDQKDHKTIKKRLMDFYGKDYNKHSASQNEIDWGKPVGNEVW